MYGWPLCPLLARVLWLCQRDSGTLNKGTKPLVISINSIIVITSAKPCSIPQAEGASPFSKLPHLTQYSNKAELILHCNYLCNIYPAIRLPAPGYQQGGSESCLSPCGKEKGNRGCSASTDEQVSEGELLSRVFRELTGTDLGNPGRDTLWRLRWERPWSSCPSKSRVLIGMKQSVVSITTKSHKIVCAL